MEILASAARKTLNRFSRTILTVALCVVLQPHTSYATETAKTVAPKPAAASLFDLESEWLNQNGTPLKWRSDSGELTILSMVYTSCQASCPLITQKMQSVERKISKTDHEKVRFLVLSFDPKRDTPSALEAYMKKHKLDPKRWTFATPKGDDARLVAAALNFKYKLLSSGDYSHSNQITLLDANGTIVKQEEDLGKLPQSLVAEIEKILRK